MAMARSLAPLLLLFALVSAAAAARKVGDSVQDACSKSQFPKVCADGLSSKPEAAKATPRRLAELFVGIAADKGSWMATFLQGKFNNNGKDGTMLGCYDSCGDDIEEAMAHLNGLIREPTDAKFLELKSWLSSTVGSGASACEEACKDAPKTSDKDDVVNNSFEFEKLLRVTLDLITEASGSMSSADIALPPSDAAAPSAYGEAAPSGASSSAEAPEAASEGPSAVGGPSAADAPAAGADAPSGAASSSSSAPSPSGSPAADAPSSGGSDAPAPSSDDSADGDEDDGDDTKA